MLARLGDIVLGDQQHVMGLLFYWFVMPQSLVLDAQLRIITPVLSAYPVRAVTDLLDLAMLAGVRHLTRLIRQVDCRVILSQLLLRI